MKVDITNSHLMPRNILEIGGGVIITKKLLLSALFTRQNLTS